MSIFSGGLHEILAHDGPYSWASSSRAAIRTETVEYKHGDTVLKGYLAHDIRGKVLVLTGDNNPSVKAEQVIAFDDEMHKAGVDRQMVIYGGTTHGFTNLDNGTDNSRGVACNEKADRRSWEEMKTFFNERSQEEKDSRGYKQHSTNNFLTNTNTSINLCSCVKGAP